MITLSYLDLAIALGSAAFVGASVFCGVLFLAAFCRKDQ